MNKLGGLMNSRFPWLLLLASQLLLPSARGQDERILISEFLADNKAVLADEDGDYPDWIELFNAESSPVDLEGWYLTDDLDNLRKWKFPAVSMPPGGFLVVFASGKDRAIAGKQLHTNFQISSDGENLAIVKPDGVTSTSVLRASGQPQIEDVSFGLPMAFQTSALVPDKAPVKAMVPADDALGTTWTQVQFDDGAWTAGLTGAGYDRQTTYDALIGLDLEAQMYSVNMSAYIRVPFNVPDPTAAGALLLRMKYDDGFVAYLNGQEVARRNAPDALAWNSKSSTSRADTDAVIPEEILLFGSQQLLVQGANVLAFHGLNQSKSDSDFLIGPELHSFSVDEIDTRVTAYFGAPTPGKPNGEGSHGIAESPEFTRADAPSLEELPSGGYAQNVQLKLQVTSPNAVIRYTTDRTIPTEASTAYAAPITIDRSTVVMARTFETGLVPSHVETRTYIKLGADAASFSSNLPLVMVNTFGKAFIDSQTNRILTPVNIMVFNDRGGDRVRLSDAPNYAGPAAMRYRGESSYGWPKRQYALEIRDERGYDRSVPLLGLTAESDWVLNGPYSDKSLMRNFLSYTWSNAIGRYAPRPRLVEVFVNAGTTDMRYAHYVGVYILLEKIKEGPDRVDISNIYPSETEQPGVTGGYIIKKDKPDPTNVGFSTTHNPSLWYVYPRGSKPPVAAGEPPSRVRVITTAERNYLTAYLRDFETALYGASYTDPNLGYAKYIDVPSFIDHHIMVELTKNIDGFRLSTYMFKDRDGLLNMGPIWDYNLSLGNADYLNGWLAQGWYWAQLGDTDYPWWRRLFQDPDFTMQHRLRWFELRKGPLSDAKILETIDTTAALLTEAAERNFQKWRILGRYDWPNWHIPQTWQDEVQWMRQWIQDRVKWIDSTFLTAPEFNQDGGAIPSGFPLEITAATGTIYYTLNGPDPMGSPDPAPEAIEYKGTISLTANTRVRARASGGGSWSTLKEATFIVNMPPLRITEIMYNPAPPPEGSPYTATDFEFIEIKNISTEAYVLGDAAIKRGIDFSFSTSGVKQLEPGECVVLVKNLDAFATRYDTSKIKIAGVYTNNMSDSGESLDLLGPLGEKILSFRYDDAWYPATDGLGSSLVILDSMGPLDSWGVAASWKASEIAGGTPGTHEDDANRPGWQLPADASQNGLHEITDGIALLQMLFMDRAPPCAGDLSAAGNMQLLDANGDALVDLSDGVYILRYLFAGGPAPSLGTECVRMAGCADACVP